LLKRSGEGQGISRAVLVRHDAGDDAKFGVWYRIAYNRGPNSMTLSAGTILGTYEIVDSIAAGGMGELYKARDTRLNRLVAIKILPPEFSNNPEFRTRFSREAQALAALSHPNICSVFDVGHENGIDYVVMELSKARPLRIGLKEVLCRWMRRCGLESSWLMRSTTRTKAESSIAT
jgi:serine/threonine protein kinase